MLYLLQKNEAGFYRPAITRFSAVSYIILVNSLITKKKNNPVPVQAPNSTIHSFNLSFICSYLQCILANNMQDKEGKYLV